MIIKFIYWCLATNRTWILGLINLIVVGLVIYTIGHFIIKYW